MESKESEGKKTPQKQQKPSGLPTVTKLATEQSGTSLVGLKSKLASTDSQPAAASASSLPKIVEENKEGAEDMKEGGEEE